MRFAERGMRIFFFLLTAYCLLLTAQAQIAIKGNTVWTMAGDPISNGVVLVKDGKIEAVGPCVELSRFPRAIA
jgi:imidazolonepropionase-like amidohydrolase